MNLDFEKSGGLITAVVQDHATGRVLMVGDGLNDGLCLAEALGQPIPDDVLPFRDVLSLGLWAWSFVTRHVHWREDRYQVTRDGSVRPVEDLTL